MPTLSGSFNISGSIITTGSFSISGSITNNGSPIITQNSTASFASTASVALRFQVTSSQPATPPPTGSAYFDDKSNKLYIYNGLAWRSASFA